MYFATDTVRGRQAIFAETSKKKRDWGVVTGTFLQLVEEECQLFSLHLSFLPNLSDCASSAISPKMKVLTYHTLAAAKRSSDPIPASLQQLEDVFKQANTEFGTCSQ